MIAPSPQRTINLLHKKKRGYCNLSESEVLAKPYPQIRTAARIKANAFYILVLIFCYVILQLFFSLSSHILFYFLRSAMKL